MRYPDGKKVSYGYDNLNRLKTVTDRLDKVTTYDYDEIGRRAKTSLPNGVVTSYDYNNANQLTGITSINANQKLLAKYGYQYDDAGNRKILSETVEGAVYTTYYDYDPLNQLEKVTNPDDSKVEYDYDPVGNRKEMKVTAGNIVTRTNYEYNEVNELTKFNVNDGEFTDFRYDANGNRTTMIQPDNRITSYSYDFENRLTKVQLHQDKWVGFEYDGDGNRITKLAAMTQPWHDNGKGNDAGFVPPGQEKVKKQQAELVFKLMKSDGGGGGGGNGGGNSGGNSGNSGNNGNGNGGNNGNAGDNGQGNGKDKNGNIGQGADKIKNKDISKEDRDKKKEQAKAKKGYREKGKHTNRGKHLGWYKNGKLTDQVVITNYVNDVSDALTQVLMTYGEDKKYDAAYTYGLERIEVEALDDTRPEAQDPLYYLYDGLGSVAYMVKPDGNMRDHYRYDAYGDTANGSKLSPDGKNVNHNTFGYTGEMWDEESNLLYLRARYYEPSTGRFLTRDTYEGELENPLSKHLYAYVEGNPVNRTDPSGNVLIVPLLIKAGSGGAADLMAQATMNYYFNPETQGNIDKAFSAVNWWQVTRSAAEGLKPWKVPGGRVGKAAATALGDVLVNAANIGTKYTTEQATRDFAVGFIGDLAGGGLGELISKYGAKNVAKGLKMMGFDDGTVARLTGVELADGMPNTVNILGKGSTGRTVANNLNEQIAMKEVMSNPLENATKVPLKNGMTDSRWLGTDGWTKMQRVITTSDGKNITIHFNYNEVTGAFDDFKFK